MNIQRASARLITVSMERVDATVDEISRAGTGVFAASLLRSGGMTAMK